MKRLLGSEAARDDSLWLELSLDGISHLFELRADEAQAIVVGSLPRADLRVDRPGIAPVHFHIERDSGVLWIVPAYCTHDLRVNAARLRGPRQIDGYAVIEFADVRLAARVIDRVSTVMRSSLTDEALTADIEQISAHNEPSHQLILRAEPTVEDASSCGTLTGISVIQPHRIVPLSNADAGEPSQCTGQSPKPESWINGHTEQSSIIGPEDTIEMLPFWMTEPRNKHEESPELDASAYADLSLTGNVLRADPMVLSSEEYGNGGSPNSWDCEVSDKGCLERLAGLGRRRPLLIWLFGPAIVFSLSAVLALINKHLGHG